MVEIVYATIKRHLMANKVEGWVWLGLECLKCRRCCLIINRFARHRVCLKWKVGKKQEPIYWNLSKSKVYLTQYYGLSIFLLEHLNSFSSLPFKLAKQINIFGP